MVGEFHIYLITSVILRLVVAQVSIALNRGI